MLRYQDCLQYYFDYLLMRRKNDFRKYQEKKKFARKVAERVVENQMKKYRVDLK